MCSPRSCSRSTGLEPIWATLSTKVPACVAIAVWALIALRAVLFAVTRLIAREATGDLRLGEGSSGSAA
jgi:hypothetical protein